MSLNKEKGTLHIYGCGGTGVKRAYPFQELQSEEGLADVTVSYIDTSKSDIPPGALLENCFLTNDTDGSGSKRGANTHIISDSVRQIAVKFAPKDINVVVMSGIGGSGSMFGPMLCKDLLMRGVPVVAIVVLSTVSQRAIMNCLDTIKTLAGQAKLANKPLSVIFHNNSANTEIENVNQAINAQITALRVLSSRSHVGLDTSDVANLLDYTNVISLQPQLNTLDILSSVKELESVPYPVTVCTIAKQSVDLSSIGMEYYCGGVMQQVYNEVDELHFATSLTTLPNVIKMLETALSKINERNGARPNAVNVLGTSEMPDDGLFLS